MLLDFIPKNSRLVVIGILCILIFLFRNVSSVECIYNKCTIYKQYTIFLPKVKVNEFSRKDVVSYELRKENAGTRKNHTTVYYPILTLKDGTIIEYPFNIQGGKARAEKYVQELMNTTKTLKNSNRFY